MPRFKPAEARKMKAEDLESRLSEMRAELTKLKTASARGTIAKESGKIRNLKHNIARILTVMNENNESGGHTE